MWWPSVQRLCRWVPICLAITSTLTATGLCHLDNPKINTFRLWRE